MDFTPLLHQPISFVVVGVALAGAALFGAAPRLPSVFPPAAIRLLGCWLVLTSAVMLWAWFEYWQLPALLAGVCFALIVVIHLRQTRGKSAPRAEQGNGSGKGS